MDSVVYAPHPHFRWQRESDIRIDETHHVQISRDADFRNLTCEDRLEVVSRFVPATTLSPGAYWWRVRRGDGPWSVGVAFTVRSPEHVFVIKAGDDAETIVKQLQAAAEQCPSRVDFEPGEYTLTPVNAKGLVTLTKAHDMIIDGHGARLKLGGLLVTLNDCQRITLQHFFVTADRPGHTLVRVIGKDTAKEALTVKVEPGHDPDVPRFFDMAGSGGSFLGCMDPEFHGRYVTSGGISARNVKIALAANQTGTFVFHPVKAATLELMPLGAVAVVTSYHWQWAQMNRTDECTFSDVTVSELPGAFCGGSNNSARSYLNCKVKPRNPDDYFGGHAATGSGRIGEWIEGCDFACLPDDGPAEQSFRQPIRGAEGEYTLLVNGNAFRTGDRVALINAKNGRGASAVIKDIAGGRARLDRPLTELGQAVGQAVAEGWKNTYLYCDAPNNEDFVYRRNRTVGGRAHGVKFNGTRAWIADNHFENLSGNAVLAGYTSEVSGHGARDVVVSGNEILRCGWTPISVWSTSGLGSNVIVRGNRITEVRESAVAIKGCDGVNLTGNTFASSTPPKQGSWITAEKTTNLSTSGNKFPACAPELNSHKR
jgi:Right handed beta helix region